MSSFSQNNSLSHNYSTSGSIWTVRKKLIIVSGWSVYPEHMFILKLKLLIYHALNEIHYSKIHHFCTLHTLFRIWSGLEPIPAHINVGKTRQGTQSTVCPVCRRANTYWQTNLHSHSHLQLVRL